MNAPISFIPMYSLDNQSVSKVKKGATEHLEYGIFNFSSDDFHALKLDAPENILQSLPGHIKTLTGRSKSKYHRHHPHQM